jgi:hypothetical protein
MVLFEIVITWDDITTAGQTINGFTSKAIAGGDTSWDNAPKVLRQLNLQGGMYRVKVDGATMLTGGVNTTTYSQNGQIIALNSGTWRFPSGNRHLYFANNSLPIQSDIKGHREFLVQHTGGNMDIEFTVQQFGQNINANVAAVVAPNTLDKTATWTSAQFSYIILSLELMDMDSKALFGQVKNI